MKIKPNLMKDVEKTVKDIMNSSFELPEYQGRNLNLMNLLIYNYRYGIEDYTGIIIIN